MCLGSDYFVERSAKQAREIMLRRSEKVSETLELAKSELKGIEMRIGVQSSAGGAEPRLGLFAQEDGSFDIREEYKGEEGSEEQIKTSQRTGVIRDATATPTHALMAVPDDSAGPAELGSESRLGSVFAPERWRNVSYYDGACDFSDEMDEYCDDLDEDENAEYGHSNSTTKEKNNNKTIQAPNERAYYRMLDELEARELALGELEPGFEDRAESSDVEFCELDVKNSSDVSILSQEIGHDPSPPTLDGGSPARIEFMHTPSPSEQPKRPTKTTSSILSPADIYDVCNPKKETGLEAPKVLGTVRERGPTAKQPQQKEKIATASDELERAQPRRGSFFMRQQQQKRDAYM